MGLAAILSHLNSEVLQKMLQKRNKIYYFRWVVPVDLRSILKATALVKSLKTPDYWTAQERMVRYGRCVTSIKVLRTNRAMGYITDEDYKDLLREIWSFATQMSEMITPQEFEDEHAHVKYLLSVQEHYDLYNKLSKGINFKNEEEEGWSDLYSYMDQYIINQLFEDSCILDFDKDDQDKIKRLRFEKIKSHAYFINKAKECVDLSSEIYPPNFQSELIPEISDETHALSIIRFTDLYAKFLDHKVKSGLSKTLQAEYKRFLSDWNELVEDKPIDEYKRKDFKNFILSILNLPKRNLREYKGKTVIELLELEIPEAHRIASNTAGQYRKWLQGVFAYSVEQELLSQSPVKNLKLNLDISKRYSNYTNIEVRSLIASAVKEAIEWHKWLVLIGVYTGMRLGEISGLVKDAIKCDEETGIDYILVTDKFGGSLKTVAAKRLVPIHSKLIEAGFMDWLSRSSDKLFNVESKTMTQWFSQFRENCNIEKYNEYDERKVFHSFRHTVITMARSKGISLDKIQQVIGHEKTSAGITDRYTHEFPLKELQEVIESIDYEYNAF